MTQDPIDNERRRELTRMEALWSNGWTRRTSDEYALALRDITPTELQEAVSEAMRTRATRPMPNQLRDIALEQRDRNHTKQREDRDRQAHTGDGIGCPKCRKEYPAGHHAYWAGDGTIISCQEHRIGWLGTTHQPSDEPDPGDFLPGEWSALALAGKFGETIQAIAERGGGPTDVIPAVTGAIRDDVHEELAAT